MATAAFRMQQAPKLPSSKYEYINVLHSLLDPDINLTLSTPSDSPLCVCSLYFCTLAPFSSWQPAPDSAERETLRSAHIGFSTSTLPLQHTSVAMEAPIDLGRGTYDTTGVLKPLGPARPPSK